MIDWPRMKDLRNYGTIQRVTETQDTDGGIVETWATFANVYFGVRTLRGDEDFAARGFHASVVHQIGIRYVENVTPKMRLLWGTRVFNIVWIENLDERNIWMILNCQEVPDES